MKCVNIDWLECYCEEDPLTYPHDAEFFRRQGWSVAEREFGTAVYQQMFKLIGFDGEVWYEVRRLPKSDSRVNRGVLSHYACHVRCANRTCYFNDVAIQFATFLEQNGLHFMRIFRLDLCLDLTRFDYGDYPDKFLQRYINGKYSKMNQVNVSAHAADSWDARRWTSVSWGSRTSPITTRMYDKTKELREVKDKPYIRQAWCAAGLVDDMNTLSKDGEPARIWRIEFEIKTGNKKWLTIESFNTEKRKLLSLPHTLQDYATKQMQLDRFYSLAEHYYHFRYYEPDQRKDRCKRKMLFDTTQINNFYKLEKIASSAPKSNILVVLSKKLDAFMQTHFDSNIRKACAMILEQIEFELRTNDIPQPWDMDEVQMLRLLISKRSKDSSGSLSEDMEQAKAFVAIEKEIWEEAARRLESSM